MPNYRAHIKRVAEEAARALGLQIVFFNASTAARSTRLFATLARERLTPFSSPPTPSSPAARSLPRLAARQRVPAAYPRAYFVEAGGLMSYGTDIADKFRQVGVYTGQILKGVKPADLPVTQSTKFEFVINLQTARALGLDGSATLLLARRRGD